MKKLATPILTINGIDYTNQLKGKTFTSGTELFTMNQQTLSNETFDITIRTPYNGTGGFNDISDPNNLIINGILYDKNLNPKLYNITVANREPYSGNYYFISNGALYCNNEMVEGQESGWTDLTTHRNEYYFYNFQGIKNGALYNIIKESRQITPAYDVTTNLYAWWGTPAIPDDFNAEEQDAPDPVTLYTLNTSPQVGDKVYSQLEVEMGTISEVNSDSIYIENDSTIYNRDSSLDTTNTKTIPAVYQTKVWCDLLDNSNTYTKLAGGAGHYPTVNNWYTYAYVLTQDNKLYQINGQTLGVSLYASNIIELYKAPTSSQDILIKTSTNYIRRLPFSYSDSAYSYSPKLDSTQKLIAPTGYLSTRYNNNIIYIVDGNLYSTWGNIFDNDGHWTHVSCGYECGYGICDGKLYKLYGTGSTWHMKVMENLTLLDSTHVWKDVYCDYSSAYALTKDGELYYIKDETLTLNKTNIPMDETQDITQTITISVGETDQSQNITISKSIIDALIAQT